MRIGRKIIFIGIICVAIITSASFGHNDLAIFLAIASICFCILLQMNSKVYRSLFAPREMTFLERNYDCLVIGDMEGRDELIPQGKKVLRFQFPNRSLYASYIILQHVFSWLDENHGEVIILVKRKNLQSQHVSEYDVPLLHQITIDRMSLTKKTTRYPLFKDPVCSIKLLLNHLLPCHYEKIDNPLVELEDFCRKRNIKLTIMANLSNNGK